MDKVQREMIVKADDMIIPDLNHVYLVGTEKVGLFPMPYMLYIWNVSDDQYLLLSRAKFISVEHEDSVLAAGDIADVYRYIVEEGLLTVVCFSLGLKLWESQISLTVEAGAKVSETLEAILEASGTDVSLLTFTGSDPVAARGQSFCCRAAEGLAISLSAASARGYLVPAGLCVLPRQDQPISMTITKEDLLSDPEYPSGNLAVLRLKVAGWPIGKKVRVAWDDQTLVGIISERMVNADSNTGPWYSEVLLEVRSDER